MAPYGKIHDSIFDSSIIEQDIELRYVWVSLIVFADREGFIDATISSLARRFNVSEELVKKTINYCLKPDNTSRSDVEDGRRLRKIRKSFGWQIINYAHYRDLARSQDRTDYMTNYMKTYRESCKQKSLQKFTGKHPVNKCKHPLTPLADINTDIDININTDKRKNIKKEKLPKKAYREFVSLTDDEYKKLEDKFGIEKTKQMIDILDNAKGAKGYKYKSDYRAILSWVVDKVEKEDIAQVKNPHDAIDKWEPKNDK